MLIPFLAHPKYSTFNDYQIQSLSESHAGSGRIIALQSTYLTHSPDMINMVLV